MAISFRKRVKLIPGVYLNLSQNGISTTIGPRGANINLNKSGGVFLNSGIPGTGIYKRQKIFNNSDSKLPEFKPVNSLDTHIYAERDIVSADVSEITSQDMENVKQVIVDAHNQRIDLNKELRSREATTTRLKKKLVLSYIFIYGLFFNKAGKIKSEIENNRKVIKDLKIQIEESVLSLNLNLDENFTQKYNELLDAFKKLTTSHKIWDVTHASLQDTVRARSSAGTLVNKEEVQFGFKNLQDVKCEYVPMYLKNANGPDLYIYPCFIIVFKNRERFAVVGFDELEIIHRSVNFTERGKVPKDSKIIDHTWAKVNKNGTRDRRFKDNYQIPIVRYGEITFKTNLGLDEEYEFSNYEFSKNFVHSFDMYRELIEKSSSVIKA